MSRDLITWPTEFRHWHHFGEVKMEHRGHWFDPSAIRFFRSRLPEHWSPLIGGRYFISSERHESPYGDSEPRLYTIREAMSDGSVETVGEFQAYTSRRQAERAASALPTDYSAHLMAVLKSNTHNSTGWIKTSKQLARYCGAPLCDAQATIKARARGCADAESRPTADAIGG